MIEITLNEWVSEAGAGMHGEPRYEEFHKAAEEGNLIVIGSQGEHLIPIKIGDGLPHEWWALSEERTLLVKSVATSRERWRR